MKIGILTFHTAYNYGAVLQAYALVKKLSNLGAETELVDYRPSFNEKRFKQKSFCSNFKSLRKLYLFIIKNGYQSYNADGFYKFINNRIPKSKFHFSDSVSVAETAKNYNAIICGSDQVWNSSCTEGDLTYFLPFEKPRGFIKASYAPSIGKLEFTQSEASILKSMIDDFDFISVREQQGVKTINKLGLSRDVEVVLDPTLLLNQKEWLNIADMSLCPKRKFLLIYLMSEDKGLIKYVRKYAEKRGLKVVYICQRFFHKFRKVEYISNATPEQWIGLFLNAEVVATNSFHGLAFAINFKKDLFVKLIPRSLANSRLINILNIMGCEDGLIADPISNEAEPIKLSSLNYENLDDNRSLSINYLKLIVSSCNV